MARYSKEEIQESLKILRENIRPGMTVYTVLRHRSASGMFRRISVLTIMPRDKRGPADFRQWDYHVCRVLGYADNRQKEGVPMSGCGMDMGYHLVNSLSYALHGRQPKGDGAKPENSGRPFAPRRGHYRAGYSLNHRWI